MRPEEVEKFKEELTQSLRDITDRFIGEASNEEHSETMKHTISGYLSTLVDQEYPDHTVDVDQIDDNNVGINIRSIEGN